ncbi:hypothetical protein [Flammeovirga kamogawensis]|uniref:SusF/SusE family outer membrane protein n=1 Tax=Flammeovirga kamogawensis TaxID=373891 RepID=A0ABX8GTL8_9BACT|nr:hypothetical protein [Flammeovirga kamogawensis]MBB6460090.1 hypothetical protein [Flammeovirga kamogawensis]QWG06866.1 hypothetical protein KM029_16385 [Flammeovirga kamogawensis]TRX68688.1 hypothetical protein EO216_11380 [Flammeovirga kamogawensis]
MRTITLLKNLSLLILGSFIISACVKDVDSTVPRTVTLKFDWTAATISGLDSGIAVISHQAGLAEWNFKTDQTEVTIHNVIGNLVVSQPEFLPTEEIAVPEQTYIIPIEQPETTIYFVAPNSL